MDRGLDDEQKGVLFFLIYIPLDMNTPRTREKPTQRRGIFKKKMYMKRVAGPMLALTEKKPRKSMYNYFSWSEKASILNFRKELQ